MSDHWEKRRLIELRDELVRSRQFETERARQVREHKRNLAKAEAAEIASEGNLQAIQLHHDLEPEKRHWDIQQLIEEERIKLETFRTRSMVETREQIKLITAELMSEYTLREQALKNAESEAKLKRLQIAVEKEYELLSQKEKANHKQSQTVLDHEQNIEKRIIDHAHAKDFKTHETDELIRLKQAFGELTQAERLKFFAQFDEETRATTNGAN